MVCQHKGCGAHHKREYSGKSHVQPEISGGIDIGIVVSNAKEHVVEAAASEGPDADDGGKNGRYQVVDYIVAYEYTDGSQDPVAVKAVADGNACIENQKIADDTDKLDQQEG